MKLECDYDGGWSGAGALGLIVLKTDETVEPETRTVFQAAGRPCYHSRIPNHALVTPETLAQMAADLPTAAGLLPEGTPFSAIGYACTSGATVIGPENVARAIGEHFPGVPTTNPLSSVVEALRHLGVKRLGILTPYMPDVTSAMQAVFEREGFEIGAVGSFEQIEDRQVARITETATLAALEKIGAGDVDAVFASCTNLRTFGIIEEAEKRLGKPVVSSNLALAWNLLRLAGMATKGTGPGRLFAS